MVFVVVMAGYKNCAHVYRVKVRHFQQMIVANEQNRGLDEQNGVLGEHLNWTKRFQESGVRTFHSHSAFHSVLKI